MIEAIAVGIALAFSIVVCLGQYFELKRRDEVERMERRIAGLKELSQGRRPR